MYVIENMNYFNFLVAFLVILVLVSVSTAKIIKTEFMNNMAEPVNRKCLHEQNNRTQVEETMISSQTVHRAYESEIKSRVIEIENAKISCEA